VESREIVRRCIEFDSPPRIARHFHVSPIDGWTCPVTDFASVSYASASDFVPSRPGMTEWGYSMESFDPTGQDMGQVKDPPIQDWSQFESYQFPDLSLSERYAHLADAVARHHTQGLYVYGVIPSLMLLPINIRGIENWFLDHAIHVSELEALLDRILDARLMAIEQYHSLGIDGVITYDDMGTDDRAMVNPKLYASLYHPKYKATCDALHERGMHLLHHCCGQVKEYLDFFVDAGLDVLQLDQPELMGTEWLGRRYGGKFCFWNPVDIQVTIPSGDIAAIEDEAHRQIVHLGDYDGGFMVKAYQQPLSVGMTIEQSKAQYDAFTKFGTYPVTGDR
jgi:hypothetical protein